MDTQQWLETLTRSGFDEKAAYDMVGALLSSQREKADESASAAAQLSVMAREAGVGPDLSANVGVYVRNGSYPIAFELLELGCPLEHVLAVAEYPDLHLVPTCVLAGVPLSAVVDAVGHGYQLDSIVHVLHQGMPADFVERYAAMEDVDLLMLVGLTSAGCTWDDARFLIESRVSLTSVGTLPSALTASVGGQVVDLASLTPSARQLALVLWLASELDLAACAAVGSVLGDAPCLPELVSLLVDAQSQWLPAWQSILTARALAGEGQALGPALEVGRWVFPGDSASSRLFDVPDASSVPSADPGGLLEWLQGSPLLLTEKVPSFPWGLPGQVHLERAVARGVSPLDVRLLATEFLDAMPVGVGPALATLALGVSREQATRWVRDGLDPLLLALLLAVGVEEATGRRVAESSRGWHALSLVASGVPLDRAFDYASKVSGDVPPQHLELRTDAGSRPIPPVVFDLLAESGLHAEDVTWSSLGLDDDPPVPVAVLQAAFRLGVTGVKSRFISEASALALAAAVTGSPVLERALEAAMALPSTSTFDRFVSLVPVLSARPAVASERAVRSVGRAPVRSSRSR